jgi:hypothetical protein
VSRDSKLDLQALRAASVSARERIQQWPAWEQEAVRAVSAVASSPQAQHVLSTNVTHDSAYDNLNLAKYGIRFSPY